MTSRILKAAEQLTYTLAADDGFATDEILNSLNEEEAYIALNIALHELGWDQ